MEKVVTYCKTKAYTTKTKKKKAKESKLKSRRKSN